MSCTNTKQNRCPTEEINKTIINYQLQKFKKEELNEKLSDIHKQYMVTLEFPNYNLEPLSRVELENNLFGLNK